MIDGKRYYVHTVLKGETLYAISRKYGVEIKDIVSENPLTTKDLKTGAVVRIPIFLATAEQNVPSEEKYIFRIIKTGDTWYSLSKQYLMSIDDLKSANHDRSEVLKLGMTVRIPVAGKNVPNSDTIVSSAIDRSEGNLARTDRIHNVQTDSLAFRDVYNVGLMLPFYLDMNDSIVNNKDIDEADEIYALSTIALGFYEGALFALDSLKKQGLSVHLFVYDTKNDTNEIIKLLKQEEKQFMKMDMIIGPLYLSELSIVVNFPKKGQTGMNSSASANLQIFKSSNHQHIVSPFITTNEILRGNPHLSKVTPCVETYVENIASYIMNEYISGKRHGENNNIIAVYNDDNERMLSDIFKNKLSELVPATLTNVKPAAYNERGMKTIEAVLSLADTNIIVIPSGDQVFVSKLISKLNELKDDYNMILFGLPVWTNFTNIETEFLHNLNVHIASPSYIDYESDEVKSFVRKYFDRYHAFPGNYAFQGFDIVYYYLNALKNYGYNFQSYLPEITNTGLQTSFEYFKTGSDDGFENRKVFILKYEDYQLKIRN